MRVGLGVIRERKTRTSESRSTQGVAMKVSEIMTRDPAWCSLSSSALTAAMTMQQKDVGILPVAVDPFTHTLVGVVTDRDLCLHVVAAGRDPARIWVSECVTQDPICCTAHDDVHVALELMKTNKVRRLPVVNDRHEIVGMLSFSDMVRRSGIDKSELLAALEQICEPGHAAKELWPRIVTAA